MVDACPGLIQVILQQLIKENLPSLVLSVCTQVRLMLVLAPATCCLGGIAADQILNTFCKSIRPEEGSGGWVGIIKAWLDGPEAQAQEDTVSVETKPAVSTTSSAGPGKRHKGSSRVSGPFPPAVLHTSH